MPIGQAQGTKITWDDAADKKLLMAMLKVASPNVPNFSEVAQVFGEGATAKALSNRWSKLKQQIDGSAGLKTAAKPKTAAKSNGGKSATKRTLKDATISDEDDDELDVKETKKVKVEQEAPNEDDEEEWLA